MRKRTKQKVNNPTPPNSFYPKCSVRGGLVETKDGKAVLIAIAIMLFFMGFCFLSVIINDSESQNENNKSNPERLEKLLLRFFR